MVDFAQAHREFARNSGSRLVPGDYFPLSGGLDLLTPPLQIKPGALIGCLNYEAKLLGGYESLAGYERYDGRTRPSQASYWLVSFTGQVGVNPAVGATITAAAGGTGRLLQYVAGVSGTVGTLVLARVTGSFNAAGALTSGGFSATQLGAIGQDSANTDDDNAAFEQLAIADQRTLVTAVPGEGRILGTAIYRGVVYAFRNAVGGLTAALYKATASGWSAIALGTRMHFSAGQAAGISAGDTLTGFSSSATGTVRRVVIQTGTFAANSAVGYVILSAVTGTFTNGESLRVGGTNRATGVNSSVPQTLLPNGKFDCRVKNFYGASGDLRLYGCDGVNRGFEFQDGTTGWFCPIFSGMVVDAPNHIAAGFLQRLWLSFPGGSVQRSSVNDPVVWSALTGAAEIGVGADVTGFLEQVTTMFVFSRGNTQILQDDGAGGVTFGNFNDKVGALTGTMQNIGSGVYLDDAGFQSIATTSKYGSYTTTPISLVVATLVKELRPHAISSAVITTKSRYRVFFDDGQFLSITIGSKVVGITRCDYLIPVRCIFSDKDVNGDELTVFGSDDGYVYVADSGTSLDGANLITFLRLPFNHSKSPGRIKRYRRGDFDISTDGSCTLFFGVDYSYARPEVTSDPTRSLAVLAGGGFWDISKWDQFRWNSGYVGQAPIKLEGSGENVSFLVSSQSTTQKQHSLDGVMLRYSNRRLERRAAP